MKAIYLLAVLLAVSAAIPQGPPEGGPPEGGPPEGGPPEGGPPEGGPPEEELPAGELPEGELPEGELPEGELPEGELPEGELPEGELPEGELPEGELPEDDTSDDTSSGGTVDVDTLQDTVKALIDAGTCDAVAATSNCGDDATGYYETFEYNGERVIIVSGAPNHAAESELFLSDGNFNPNTRCERWQYSVVPLAPEKSDSTDWTDYTTYPYYDMGAYGYATSGGVFFDTRSSPDGETAWDNEIDTLDTCMGHSNDALQYHYHGVPYCIPEDTWLANKTSVCQFVGYMLDGYPVYGRCNHTNDDGTTYELESCWSTTASAPNHLANYTYSGIADLSGDCLLDQANGYDFTAGLTSDGYVGYGYVTTTEFSGVPIGFMGTVFGEICGITT